MILELLLVHEVVIRAYDFPHSGLWALIRQNMAKETNMKSISSYIVNIILLYFAFMTAAFAANECRIQYGWNTGNSFQGTFKNNSGYLFLNKGQVKFVNKTRMNFIKNLNNNQVKVFLTNVISSPITLNKNQRNPAGGMYAGTPKFVKIQCLNTAASSAPSASGGVSVNVSASALITSLLSSGRTPSFIAGQLVSKFNLNVQTIANLFMKANISADDTVSVLKNRFKLPQATARRILLRARFQSGLIMAALNKYYGMAQTAAKRTADAARSRARQTQTRTNRTISRMNTNNFSSVVVTAAVEELKGWFLFATISQRRCKVTASNAIAGAGVFTSRHRWRGRVKDALIKAKVAGKVASAWDKAYKDAFENWARNVTIPSLPMYPTFAAFPGPVAPETLNVPMPLGVFVSQGLIGMSPRALTNDILNNTRKIGGSRYMREIRKFAALLSARFTKFLAAAPVINVKGYGTVPSFKRNRAPGPVVGGCFGRNVLGNAVGTL